MSKLSALFKKLAAWSVANKGKSIIIGTIAAIVIVGTPITVAIISNSHEHTPNIAVTEDRKSVV